ncbi:hypothetical protein ELH73_13380 [Rhizobium leguminosarum]|uniref:Uncharacterized protein n=1 Tax=Rhizobium leguminosarum TaxID=384 RepID=A0ABD7PYZ0_RHILE|nr:hypothetical protein ELI28_13000 [Rhizobium leguminosarum]TAV81120.1 hypothetical protein ELI27_12990 [Rhizobium leguminosarum]TAW32467.1 hypothetical protein ELI19_13180 [Rhizobium leguminosarum]TAW46200.1 hypothetical protein ELI18_13135 [Rhizobium leguminosarum]TAX37369.1 hypothetical protein ELI06_13640 [Rhizobium leguminosarum]
MPLHSAKCRWQKIVSTFQRRQQFVFRGYAISKFRFEKGKRGTLFFRVCNSVAAPKAGTSKDRPDKADVG